ncbi:YwpF-like family protein [Anaerobacillus sp. CMMVII]|uniref:YwpF-like family protein n=1 Tax=Anaerobacillus sp. CMMVII TaxID=2755588 RepID=UPI0021B76DFC|nr:YwpF-like family protein [Anaerobacillus sp. CMMVII]MCT8137930.1 YwpF-like family protein [Anaerobacillus sp. CMMVII]
MKTFKLCSLVVLLDTEIEPNEIELIDGLIINKEEAQKNWLIEAVVEPELESYFKKLHETQEKFMVEATITKRSNAPATFVSTVKSINKITNNVSVLLDGLLVVKEDDFSDMILRSILEEGFEGEEILIEFKRRKKDRGRAIQGALNNAFVEVKGKFFD